MSSQGKISISQVHDILGSQNVLQVAPDVSVYLVDSTGEDLDESRKLLFKKLVSEFHHPILRFATLDKELEDFERTLKYIGPSLWVIPDSTDTDSLYTTIRNHEWGIYPISGELEPVIFGYGDHMRKLMWIKYMRVPYLLENNHWRGKWILTLNPSYYPRGELVNMSSSEFGRGNEMLVRVLNAIAVDTELSDSEEYISSVNWLAHYMSPEDRAAFLNQAKGIMSPAIFPLNGIQEVTGMTFGRPDIAESWLRRVSTQFEPVLRDVEIEEKLIKAAEDVLHTHYFDLSEKGIFAIFDGVWINSRDPYDAALRIRILAHTDGQEVYNFQNQVNQFNVPIFIKGEPMPESFIRETIRREIRTTIAVAPFVRFFGFHRFWFQLPGHFFMISVILLFVCILLVLLILPRMCS